MHEKRVARAYHTELWVGIGVYAVLLVGSIKLARPMADGTLRTVLLLLPMLGFALAIRAIVRHVARIDEYQRLRMLESIGIAFAVTGALTFSYGFLETAGFPKVSMFAVWIVMCTSWVAVNLVRAWRSR
ncbi:hypothetical protein [Massilia phyllosphaerae]|uniref:hypothetical protein n=1 Tax=Massilia phyllosphaerae TaxID=3106034 RepID=UPI002B1CD3B1|nr:hypothetical protein [Massilia sp. SGZ-792]